MIQNFAKDHLRQFVMRIERMEEEKRALADDVKQTYAEAKGHGFDVKILRQVIRLRKMDRADLAEQEELLALYMDALNGNGTEATNETITTRQARPAARAQGKAFQKRGYRGWLAHVHGRSNR